MTLRRLGLFACVAAVALPFQQGTQVEQGRITGYVGDPIGAPIPGAGVELRNPGGTVTIATASTGNRGDFLLAAVPPGKYQLQFDAQGFKPSTHTVDVRSGSEAVVRPRLSIDLDEAVCILTVTAESLPSNGQKNRRKKP